MNPPEISVAHYPYYHGILSREEACMYLEHSKKGSFVVRDSSRGPGCLVISLVQPPKILHLLVKRDKKNHFMLDPDAWKDHSLGNESFAALQLLIARLQQYGMLSDGLSKADLKNISSEIDSKKKDAPAAAVDKGSPAHDKEKGGPSVAVESKREDENTTGKDEQHLSPPPSPIHRALTLLQKDKEKTDKSAAEEEELKKAMFAMEAEAEYKGMLNAMMVDKLNGAKLANLEEFRKKHGISADQHNKVLKSLGLTPQQFADMKRAAERNDTTAADSETECIICLSRPRQIAFVSCGHVATCVQCTEGLSVCPVCRKTITSTMRIFT